MNDISSSSSIDIQNTKGGNIIGKDINVVINKAQSYGINLLSTNYFKEYKSTPQDLKDWRNGFSFKLEAIKEKGN
jgi:hypothetical protein